MVLVRESWDTPFLLESQSNSRASTETGWLRPTRWGFVCKMSLKAPFRSYKSMADRDWPICCSLLDAESTGFGPKRLRCSVPPLFPIEHCWTSGHVLLRTPVTWSPCLQGTGYNLLACLTFFGCTPVTRVELELNLGLGVKVVACWRGDQVIWAPRSTWPLVQPCSIGNIGGTLHRNLFGPKPVDSASKGLQHMGQSRSSVLL